MGKPENHGLKSVPAGRGYVIVPRLRDIEVPNVFSGRRVARRIPTGRLDSRFSVLKNLLP